MKIALVAVAIIAPLLFGQPLIAGEPAPRVEITTAAVRPGERLRVWVACPHGTRAGDVQSAVWASTVLEAQPAGRWWFAGPVVAAHARPGAYTLRARCTPGPGSPYARATAPFAVRAVAQHWIALSTTALAITGDASVTSSAIVFAAGGRLDIRYLKDVPGSVSVLGDLQARAHAQLYRVLSRADLRLRSGNTLCGKRPTYLTTLRTGAPLDADIVLTIYTATAEPGTQSANAICASYTYFPQAP